MLKNSKKSIINIRIDVNVKAHLDLILTSNGMTISEAMRLYIWQIVTQGGIPYKGFVTVKKLEKEAYITQLDMAINDHHNSLRRKLITNQTRKDQQSQPQPH